MSRDGAGNLPPEMSRMSQLMLLDLRHNKIGGRIPPLFGRLTNLQQLWLQDNQLTGEEGGRQGLDGPWRRAFFVSCTLHARRTNDHSLHEISRGTPPEVGKAGS